MSQSFNVGDLVEYRDNTGKLNWLFLVIGLNEWFNVLCLRAGDSDYCRSTEVAYANPGDEFYDIWSGSFEKVDKAKLTPAEEQIIASWIIRWEQQHQQDKIKLQALCGDPIVIDHEPGERVITTGEL